MRTLASLFQFVALLLQRRLRPGNNSRNVRIFARGHRENAFGLIGLLLAPLLAPFLLEATLLLAGQLLLSF
jgi:hypothetical protein